jgi:hypothetical protein
MGVGGGQLLEGDADVRGIRGQVVHEDADDLPLGFHRHGVAADSAAVGPDDDDAGLGGGAGGGASDRVGQLGGVSTAVGTEGEGEGGEGTAAAFGGDIESTDEDDAAAELGAGVLGTEGGGATAAAAAAGDDAADAAGGVSDADAGGEYGPHEVDGLEAGAIDEGGFVPASYVRHR